MNKNSWHWNLLLSLFWKNLKRTIPSPPTKRESPGSSPLANTATKNIFLIILSYFCCGFLLLLFSPDLSFIMSLLSFFVLSSLLYEDRVVPLARTFWFTIIQAPSFFLLVAFFNLAKTFSASGSFAMMVICLAASFVAILVNVFYCQLAFSLNFRKNFGINDSLLEAFVLLTKNYKLFLSATLMSLLFSLMGFGSTEVIILVSYPLWTFLSLALINILMTDEGEWDSKIMVDPAAEPQVGDHL